MFVTRLVIFGIAVITWLQMVNAQEERKYSRVEGILQEAQEKALAQIDQTISEKARRHLALVQSKEMPEVGIPKKKLIDEKGLSIKENDNYLFMESGVLSVVVEKETGLLHRLVSAKPVPYDILPPTANGLVVYMYNSQFKNWMNPDFLDWFGIFNKLASYKIDKGKEGKDDFISLDCNIELDNAVYKNYARLLLIYKLFSDRMHVSAKIEYLMNDPSEYEIHVGHGYDKSLWTRQIIPTEAAYTILTMPVDASEEEKVKEFQRGSWDSVNKITDSTWAHFGGESPRLVDKIQLRYYDAMWEVTPGGKPEWPSVILRYPVAVLEGKDRFLLWGCMDVSYFTNLTPNYHRHIPSFTIHPKNLVKGDSYRFDWVYKVFPKPEKTITDVFRWHAQNLYSSNPMTADLVTMPKEMPHRTIPPFNFSNHITPEIGWPGQNISAERLKLAQVIAKEMGFYGFISPNQWKKWDETVQTEGEWMNENFTMVNAKTLKADIEYIQKAGFKTYAYLRQIYRSWGLYDDKPPYKKWIIRGKYGWPFNVWTGFSKDHKAEIRKDQEPLFKELGIPLDTPSQLFHVDFSDPELRAWYLTEVQRAMDYYNFDGIFFDMSWDMHVGFSGYYPDTGVHQGILKVIADTRKWLNSKYPEKKIIMNFGNVPIQLWVDAIDVEAGTRTDKLMLDVLKIYNMPVINLNYASLFKGVYEPKHGADWYKWYFKDILRLLSYGATWGGHGVELGIPSGMPELENRAVETRKNLGKVALFSATANSVPWVTESGFPKIEAGGLEKITASVWADENHLMMAIYNDEGKETAINVKFPLNVLESYGQAGNKKVSFWLVDGENTPRMADDFKIIREGDNLVVAGTLPVRTLLLME